MSDDQAAETTSSEPHSDSDQMEVLRKLFARFQADDTSQEEEEEKPEQLLPELTIQGVAEYLKSEKCKNVIVMCGAGISTSAGIPDFRSPGTGLYDNLQKYDLPSPQSIFEIGYFKENPQPFFTLAKELYPGKFKPTWSHYFIKLLEEKGLLARVYTQPDFNPTAGHNYVPAIKYDVTLPLVAKAKTDGLVNIDTLERVAGVSGEKIVEAHGAFHTAHCVECKKEYTQEWVKDKIFDDEIPHCTECESLVKPDIVFFGEPMPERFFRLRLDDLESCDLLIVMGTSLRVQPFASLVNGVTKTTPRLLINREKSGEVSPMMAMMGLADGMDFDSKKAYRDVALLGDCDEGCKALGQLLEWEKDLEEMVKREHARIDGEDERSSSNKTKKTKENSDKKTTNSDSKS